MPFVILHPREMEQIRKRKHAGVVDLRQKSEYLKYHYRYARGYLDLALNSFKADLQGVDKTPTLFEGEEYQAEKGIICAKQMVIEF